MDAKVAGGAPICRRRARAAIGFVFTIVVGIGGCGGPAPATTAPVTTAPTTTAPATVNQPTTVPTPTVNPTLAVDLQAENAPYQFTDPVLQPGSYDAYSPDTGSDFPVVVMFHGTPSAMSKAFLAEYARHVANAGFLVFVADWGHIPTFGEQPEPVAYAAASNAQVGCALDFFAQNAPMFGGDPETLLVFGHSGGSNVGSVAAFGGTAPGETCREPNRTADIDALITWDGNFLLAPDFDTALKADPGLFDLMTPWSVLSRRPDLPVFMLTSETPGGNLEAPMPPEAVGPYLALRDHDGLLGPLVEKVRPFDDGKVSMSDEQLIFLEGLRQNANPVTFTVVPGSTHVSFSERSWTVFTAQFLEALEAANS